MSNSRRDPFADFGIGEGLPGVSKRQRHEVASQVGRTPAFDELLEKVRAALPGSISISEDELHAIVDKALALGPVLDSALGENRHGSKCRSKR